jgi:heme-degrading monooxygenase HmoA
MVTIVTEVQLKEGSATPWDQIMRERMSAATKHSGWIGGQLLQPDNDPQRRVIVGTWNSRDDWKEWHTDPRFQKTRSRLDQLVRGPEECAWHDVLLEVRKQTGRERGA